MADAPMSDKESAAAFRQLVGIAGRLAEGPDEGGDRPGVLMPPQSLGRADANGRFGTFERLESEAPTPPRRRT